MNKTGFIGTGNMAEALIKGVIDKKVLDPENIHISDIRKDRLEALSEKYNVQISESNDDLVNICDCIFLSIKPQNMHQVLDQLDKQGIQEKLFVSIAAGITTEKIESILGEVPVIRVMPNTPALIAQGASAMFANKKAKDKTGQIEKILSAVGIVQVLTDESLMDAVTAVSGSGPAYFFYLMQYMIEAAEELGLDDLSAKKLVLQTAKGSALLAETADKTDESCAQLRDKVTSPGGTTEAAIKVFDKAEMNSVIKNAVKKAAERSKQLSG